MLGFNDISQYKSFAVADYLQKYRPDRDVKSLIANLQEVQEEEINSATMVFVCTGDVMSEKWLLSEMTAGIVRKPAILLWLEAYGISGIMIYINPYEADAIQRLTEKANDSFMDYCLIKREEYADERKLIQRDAGCNGSYALYSANDVTMFLSSVFPIIDRLLERPTESKCYRWIGNIDIAQEKGISLVQSEGMSKNTLQELPV